MPYYVFGTVVADSPTLGAAYVGLLSAVIVLVGAAIALPAAYAANKYGPHMRDTSAISRANYAAAPLVAGSGRCQ